MQADFASLCLACNTRLTLVCPLYSCTALAYVYGVATGNNTNPEIFFDAYQDPYQTTGALSLQIELEDFQLEDIDVNILGYNLSIYNDLYNYVEWTSNYAVDPLVGGCSHPLCHCCFQAIESALFCIVFCIVALLHCHLQCSTARLLGNAYVLHRVTHTQDFVCNKVLHTCKVYSCLYAHTVSATSANYVSSV